jgi:hypothetical protein
MLLHVAPKDSASRRLIIRVPSGVSGTSLAVALGALSIGLGFGI